MKRYKRLAAILIIFLTFAGFIIYFVNHPGSLHPLRSLSLGTVVLLLLLYLGTLVSLIFNLRFSLALLGKRMPLQENALLTIYSTIVNFFGPLQSGPGVRAVYLKKRHSLKLKDFLYVSLIYYLFFAVISAVFLFGFSLVWWQGLLLTALVIVAIVLGFLVVRKRFRIAEGLSLKRDVLIKLFLVTLLQLFIVSVIYFVELHTINHHISYRQAVVYTGAADFALFVSLTPGAIGFRESFLLFSEHLHHISTANVLAASLIDRAMYLVFLAVLFGVALSLHAKDRLKLSAAPAPKP